MVRIHASRPDVIRWRRPLRAAERGDGSEVIMRYTVMRGRVRDKKSRRLLNGSRKVVQHA